MNRFTHFLITVGPLLIGTAGAIVSIKIAETPYIWIFLSLLLAFLLAATTSLNTVYKAIWLNGGTVMAILLLVECYWMITSRAEENSDVSLSYSHDYITEHDVLGYAPIKDNSVTASKYNRDKLIYEVNYTIDEHGLRMAPPSQPEAPNCILFFGGSFTFGEGVNNNESLPYRVGLHSNEQYRIYNFGFHGYGPHQMLAALEQGLVDDAIQCKPELIIYQGIVAHIMRSLGLTTWDSHGPQYMLNENQEVEYAGHFDDAPTYRLKKLLRLNESIIFRKLFGTQRPVRQQDLELYVGIIARAEEVFKSQYPDSEFHIILWGDTGGNNVFSDLLTLIKEQKMNIHPRSELIPLYTRNADKYELSKYDHHPNAIAHDLVAQYITARFLHH